MRPRVVLDTNVLVSALRSRRGASHRVLSLLGTTHYDCCLSIPLLLEYEDVLRRPGSTSLTQHQIDDVLDYLCSVAIRQDVFYLWRPYLRDPRDDMVLELAVAADCQSVITFNTKDFVGIERFGITASRPQDFLIEIGALG